jgi:hypothetical protein
MRAQASVSVCWEGRQRLYLLPHVLHRNQLLTLHRLLLRLVLRRQRLVCVFAWVSMSHLHDVRTSFA